MLVYIIYNVIVENDKIKAQHESVQIADENEVLKQQLQAEVLMLKQEINEWKCKYDTITEQLTSYTKEAGKHICIC